jgi:hypothetical protein
VLPVDNTQVTDKKSFFGVGFARGREEPGVQNAIAKEHFWPSTIERG